jgi:hypothetical protein
MGGAFDRENKQPNMRKLLRFAAVVSTLLAGVTQLIESPEWPRSGLAVAASAPADPDRALVQAQTVCVASSVWSAGQLGDTLAYHFERHGDRLKVGYFAYWSSERPWGMNTLSLSVAPALLVDGLYSHLFFVLPGVRQAMYGSGDIEGAAVTYRVEPDGTLEVESALADNETHDEVKLSRTDLLDERGRLVLMSEVWSHQLGAHGAARRLERAASQRCYHGRELVALTPELARRFRLGSAATPRRAKPAWRIGGS